MAAAKEKQLIKPLQGLRALAFLGVFLNHSVGGMACTGAAGVSVFFVLSGFLMTYSYWDSAKLNGKLSLIEGIAFAWRKIRKLYPLHICMTAFAVAYSLVLGIDRSIPHFLTEIGINVLLLQAWIPASEYYFSLNAVSWYLSAALFTYMVFPFALPLIRKAAFGRAHFLPTAILLLLIGGMSVCAFLFGDPADQGWFSRHWITYIFPVARALDFLLGASMAGVFMRNGYAAPNIGEQNAKRNRVFPGTALEVASIALIAAAVCAFRFIPHWLQLTAIYAIPSALIVYIFARGSGLISKLLSMKPFVFVGRLSGQAFLIHLYSIKAVFWIVYRLFPQMNDYLLVLIALVVTLAVSEAARRLFGLLEQFFAKRKERKA